MTFTFPAGFALLAAVPLLVWLHRRRAPHVVRVASLAPYRAAAGEPAPQRSARGTDATLVLLVASVVCLACAATEPTIAGGTPVVTLRIDRSPSMSALTVAGPTVRASAVGRARRLVSHALPGAEIRETDLVPPAAGAGGPELGVIVTDRIPTGASGEVIVGPEHVARPNLGIVGALLVAGGSQVVVTVRNHSAESATASVQASSGELVQAAITARSSAEVTFAAPARGGHVEYRLRGPDSLDLDDVLLAERRGGAARVRARNAGVHVLSALRALGADVADAGETDATIECGGPVKGREEPTIQFAATVDSTGAAPSVGQLLRVVAGTRSVAGSSVTSRAPSFMSIPLPAPAARLVATGRLVGGDVLWEDAEGALAVRVGRRVVIALDPDAPDSDWAREGSFPAMIAAALDLVTDGPDRLRVTVGVPPVEGDVASEVLPDPDPDAIRRAAATPDPVRLGGWLALVGACAAAGAALVAGRRRLRS
ncbi:MAG: BatA domain-containing protein [Planctomycetes bacterium]|nr:BatA domain-containing protein [Planctomycetota bacterium]